MTHPSQRHHWFWEGPGLRHASRLRVGLWEGVTLQTFGKDMYRHTFADVLLLDGTNVNPALVKDSWCWWYRKYAPGDTIFKWQAREAREEKKGLWVDSSPIPPWE